MMPCADLHSLKHPKKHHKCMGKWPSRFCAAHCQPQLIPTTQGGVMFIPWEYLPLPQQHPWVPQASSPCRVLG